MTLLRRLGRAARWAWLVYVKRSRRWRFATGWYVRQERNRLRKAIEENTRVHRLTTADEERRSQQAHAASMILHGKIEGLILALDGVTLELRPKPKTVPVQRTRRPR